jgi:carboxyl-terminal processing protease
VADKLPCDGCTGLSPAYGYGMKMFFVLAAVLFVGVIPLALADDPSGVDEDSPYEQMQILARAMQLIRQDFVDADKVSYRDLTYSALRGMLAELDPHSAFMEPSDFDGMQEDTKSEFGGLGVVVTVEGNTLTIVAPMEDSPGFEAGLEPGDKILRIDGKTAENLTLAEAVEHLRGEIGEKVTLTIQRPSTNEIRDFTLTRQRIKVSSVKDAHILPGDGMPPVGYVRITQFNEPTASELARALEKLEAEGVGAIVLDLRYNPGGLLGSAVDVCGLFVPPGTPIVTTEGRSPGKEYHAAARAGKFRDYPVAVLVNHASASGSEVVAGALKDLGRGLVVGEKTFGKGSVQSVLALPDGSAVRFTTQKYYTPLRDLIHEHGVDPHIRVSLTPEQEVGLLRARRERVSQSKTPEDIENDPQLSRAVDALRGVLLDRARAAAAGKEAGG